MANVSRAAAWCGSAALALLGFLAAPASSAGPTDGFRRRQATAERVVAARAHVEAAVKKAFAEAGVDYPAPGLLLRAFKADAELELWGQKADGTYAQIKRYRICAASGGLGPKRRQGDLQVPEGFYRVDIFNPASAYHLALGVDYPNESDRILGHKPALGGQIMIHGDCVTIGCIPIEDAFIEEVYLAVLDSYLAGHETLVHIFPTRLDDAGLERIGKDAPADLLAFWQGLAPAYTLFEADHRVPKIRVDPKTGAYRIGAR